MIRFVLRGALVTIGIVAPLSLAGASESEFDLVAGEGYLGSCDPPISCENITDWVLEYMESN